MPDEISPEMDHDAAFVAALLRPDLATPAPVTAAGGKKADKRYNVYRNNVTVSLVNALADIFPAVQKIAGETNFRAVARDHVRSHPPSTPLLFRYGEDFPPFLETIEPIRQRMPYLPDVARLERAWLTAFHAADIAIADPAALTVLPEDRIGEAIFVPHPATAIIMSDFAVFEIFSMNRGFSELKAIDVRQPQAALVTRPDADVQVTGFDHATGVFFLSLLGENPLGIAAADAIAFDDTFDLGGALTLALQTGAFAEIRLPSANQEQQ